MNHSTPFYRDSAVTIHHGNCLDVLRTIPSDSVDSCVTDPPYGLSNTSPAQYVEALTEWVQGNREFVPSTKAGFLGKDWDAFVPPPAVWDQVYRVLKPGSHAFVFAGSRTMGIMETSLRFAGFDVRDSVAWLHGNGFPKSLNVQKATGDPSHEGLGTALKPAFEPVIMVRKPFRGTVAANVQEHGTGALNIDACRIGDGSESKARHGESSRDSRYTTDGGTNFAAKPGVRGGASNGRFPANVVLDESQSSALDDQSGNRRGFASQRHLSPGTPGMFGRGNGVETRPVHEGYNDNGGASRFFYCAKASKKERPVGPAGEQHPTVKPLSLMRWLVRLGTPAGGTILDPFGGSGTTCEAAILEGLNPILIEQHAPYLPLILSRVHRASSVELDLFGGAA